MAIINTGKAHALSATDVFGLNMLLLFWNVLTFKIADSINKLAEK